MPPYMLPTTALELLTVSGPDARRLLQGQLTCDLDALKEGDLLWGAVCNNKGRVLCPFVVFLRAASYHLVFAQGLADIFAANMRKFLPFYKCNMEPGGACVGLAGEGLEEALQQAGLPLPGTTRVQGSGARWVARLVEAPALVLVGGDIGELAALAGSESDHQEARRHWLLALLLNGHYPFEPGDSERYTPQDLHYDRKGYVSFSKGCYTGQEIVARMHYRGKAKKQLYLARLKSNSAPLPEDLLFFDTQGNALGHARVTVQQDAGHMLALVSLSAEIAPEALPLRCESAELLEIAPF